MKMWISLMLALLLAVGMCAQAETQLTGSYTFDKNWSLEMNRKNGAIFGYNRENGVYTLVSADGRALTTQPYIYMRSTDIFMEVAVEQGLNVFGLIDAQGNQIMPMQYGDINILSDRWQLGVRLVEATADNYDYKGNGAFYMVEAYDVYHCGKLVGVLGRLDYYQSSVRGDYLYVRDHNGAYHYYNSALKESGYQADYPGYSEYDELRSGKYHQGSGQQAFVPGCTLTADAVEEAYSVVNGAIVDLQGNEVGRVSLPQEATIYGFIGDYTRVKSDGKYGLMHYTGRMAIPCEYDDIAYSDSFFQGGYQLVEKNGKLGYVNENGEVTCDFKYAEGSWDNAYKSPLNSVTDMEGNVIVLSGAVGELPDRYAEVYTQDGCPMFAAQDLSGNFGVVDIYGKTVIPFDKNCDDTYDFTIANDGSVVLTYNIDRAYTAYTFTDDGAASAPEVIEVNVQASAAAPAEGWTCVCGSENSGNFCANCGATRPVEPEAPASAGWTCACGSVNEGNFCPNCGSARPAEKLVCSGCGFEPEEGSQPKFCMQCGAAF